ncbi:MAG: thioredoxin family protein [Halobacteriovoraceae bacterium]|nr:thioredoxin family protein [Halobacteriovoraceae bacterium]
MEKINTENFENVVNNEKGLFVIKFSSPTCGPCKTMGPVFEALDQNNPEVNVYEVDTMESPEIASHFGVRGVPYVVYCEEREVLYDFTGVTPLGSLQYVINNINDPYFRETGEFKQPAQKKTYIFEGIVGFIVLVFLGLFFLL